jgi:hypothetical protein
MMDRIVDEKYIKNKKRNFKLAVKKLPIVTGLQGIQDILLQREQSIFTSVYLTRVQDSIPLKLLPIIIPFIADAFISYSNVDKKFNRNDLSDIIVEIFRTAMEFFVDCEIVKRHPDPVYNLLSFCSRIEDSQGSMQKPETLIGTAYTLFYELTDVEDKFSFKEKFFNLTGMEVNIFLASFLPIFQVGREGIFSNQNFKIIDDRIRIKQSDIEKALSLISCYIDRYKNIRKKTPLSTNDWLFKPHEFIPLRIYPVLNIAKNKYISPVPSLIIQNAIEIIYYIMQTGYGEEFSSYFGRLFERYCDKIMESISVKCEADYFLKEEDIKKRFSMKTKKVVDFMIVKDKKTVLIEYKAARIYRETVRTSNMESYYKKQLYPISTSISKFEEMKKHLLNNYAEQFEEIFCLTITSSVIPGLNTPAVLGDLCLYITHLYTVEEFPNFLTKEYNIFDLLKDLSLSRDPDSTLQEIIKEKSHSPCYQKENVKKLMRELVENQEH